MKRITTCFGILCLAASLSFAQAPAAVEDEFEAIYQQVSDLKAIGEDIPAELELRFFELERIIYPNRQERDREGMLDQGSNDCAGAHVFTQPTFGTDTTYGDAGQTFNASDNCDFLSCARGKDNFWILDINYQDDILIHTCGSSFDTRLCIFKEDPTTPDPDCCNPAALYVENDDNEDYCGIRARTSAVDTCFIPGRYYIVLDGEALASQGDYRLRIEFRYDDCEPPEPPAECPPTFGEHEESPGNDEEPCIFTNIVSCDTGICGNIDDIGDLDVFEFQVGACADLTASLYADSSEVAPGGTGFRKGLDGLLWLYTTVCEAPIATNDDILLAGVGLYPPVGTDSQIHFFNLRPGVPYFIVVAGANGTAGPYELTLDCQPCED